MGSRRVAFAMSLAFALLAPLVARADESDDALARGVALRRERRDAEALVEFQRAYAAKHAPRALAQVALAEAALGKWVAAESDLARALVVDDEWITRQRAALQVALTEIQTHLGALDVSGAPEGDVWLDDESVGRTPLVALRVAVGHHRVELRAPTMIAASREVDVAAGSTVRVEIALSPAPVAASPPPLVVLPARAAEPPPQRAGDARRTWAWTAAGGAAVFAAGGVASTIWGATSAAHYDAASCDAPGSPRSVQCASTRSHVTTAEALEVVGYSAAGAAAITAAILFFTGHPADAKQASLRCAPSLGSVWCSYTF